MSRTQRSPEMNTKDTAESVETFMPALERQAKLAREYIQFLEMRIHNLEMLLAANHTKKNAATGQVKTQL